MNTFSLDGKVLVITGASRGIGRGLVSYFLQQGARVAAVARSEARAQTLRAELAACGEQAEVYVMDVCKVSEIQTGFAQIAQDFGRIDLLVNNAGMGHPVPALEITEQDWDEMMDLNLKGAFFCAQAAAKYMIPQGYGRIVNISSQASTVAIEGETVYCASKGGMNQMTKVLALEWAKFGVTVNAVGPTFTYTPGTAERLDQPQFRAQVLKNIPRGRIGSIEDIAGAVHYLCSDSADMVNGALLLVDGGWTIV